MKKLLLISIALIFITIPIFAEQIQPTDYSNVKGDFKIIYLGDSKKVVFNKINYLISKKEVVRDDQTSRISTEILGEIAYINFYYDNKILNKMTFLFKNTYFGQGEQYFIELKNFHDKVRAMFFELYGQPTTENPYPEIIVNDEIDITNEWRLDKKTIVIGISRGERRVYRNTYRVAIHIIDNQMLDRKNEKQEFDSKNDF